MAIKLVVLPEHCEIPERFIEMAELVVCIRSEGGGVVEADVVKHRYGKSGKVVGLLSNILMDFVARIL